MRNEEFGEELENENVPCYYLKELTDMLCPQEETLNEMWGEVLKLAFKEILGTSCNYDMITASDIKDAITVIEEWRENEKLHEIFKDLINGYRSGFLNIVYDNPYFLEYANVEYRIRKSEEENNKPLHYFMTKAAVNYAVDKTDEVIETLEEATKYLLFY